MGGTPKSKKSAAGLTDSQLHRLIYSNWDFQQALSALTFLLEDCNFDEKYSRVELRRFRCYETSCIISFARPFESSRGQTTIGLKTIGAHLDADETRLKDKVLALRRKAIAHSDDDHMHFRAAALVFNDSPVRMPFIQYSESLYLKEGELRSLEELLRRLVHTVANALFEVAQTSPERFNIYKVPHQAPTGV